MITLHFGSIPLGSDALSGPTSRNISRQATYAQYNVTRGKPVLHDVGEELDTQSFDFFFSEEFCEPVTELNKLELAFAMKTPLPLLFTAGGFTGLRYVVEALDVTVRQTNRSGAIVRVEATLSLIEAPATNLLDLVSNVARALAPAISTSAVTNPTLKR